MKNSRNTQRSNKDFDKINPNTQHNINNLILIKVRRLGIRMSKKSVPAYKIRNG